MVVLLIEVFVGWGVKGGKCDTMCHGRGGVSKLSAGRLVWDTWHTLHGMLGMWCRVQNTEFGTLGIGRRAFGSWQGVHGMGSGACGAGCRAQGAG